MKDLLTNVGSGGGAAAPAAGGAAAAAGGDDAPAEEAKEEGSSTPSNLVRPDVPLLTPIPYREGGIRRGHGFRSLRLNSHAVTTVFLLLCTSTTSPQGSQSIDLTAWRGRNMSCVMDKVVSYTSNDGRDECLNDGVHVGKELVNLRTQKGMVTVQTNTRFCQLFSLRWRLCDFHLSLNHCPSCAFYQPTQFGFQRHCHACISVRMHHA